MQKCHSCGIENINTIKYCNNLVKNEGNFSHECFLCYLCASSDAGTQFIHYEGSDIQRIMAVICYVGNEIIKAIEHSGLK